MMGLIYNRRVMHWQYDLNRSFEWYGVKFKPQQVKHIREAHDRRLGRMDVKNLVVKTVKL